MLAGFDLNKDVAQQNDVPLQKGVPALAVLDADHQVVYSQKNGEFKSMQQMIPSLPEPQTETRSGTCIANFWLPWTIRAHMGASRIRRSGCFGSRSGADAR